LLLSNGAEINRVNKAGETALHVASENGHTQTVESLLSNRAKVNKVDKKGQTALHRALNDNKEDCIRVLCLAHKILGVDIPVDIINRDLVRIGIERSQAIYDHIKDSSNKEPIYVVLRHWIDKKGLIESLDKDALDEIVNEVFAIGPKQEAIGGCLDIINLPEIITSLEAKCLQYRCARIIADKECLLDSLPKNVLEDVLLAPVSRTNSNFCQRVKAELCARKEAPQTVKTIYV